MIETKLDLPVVIRVFNEAKNIEKSFYRHKSTLEPLALKYEIIFVNGGTTDESQCLWEEL